MAPRIIGHHQLKAEMQAVARGERPAPPYAGQATFNSVEALTRLLATIRDQVLRGVDTEDLIWPSATESPRS